MDHLKKIIIIFVFLPFNLIFAQSESNTVTVTDTFSVNLENTYHIKSVSIIPKSESLFLNDSLLSHNSYLINYEKGIIHLSKDLNYNLLDTLYVIYSTYRISLRKTYQRRSLIYKYDQKISDSIRVVQAENSAFTSESIFGENIRKSGTIVRGFTVGTNKDFTLDSGLRLQLSGKLSDNIEIVAALTDQNTPIQPEGNTETLEELDKVFIEIRHPNAIGTFGDYNYNADVGEFGVINRKLQGLKAEVKFDNIGGTAAVASSRGKFITNKFNGSDGVQGPYRLSGQNNEKSIIVIAGSEKVYVDGELMKRGENNDYTIEYANAEITFTPNRLITSASRISVDFEYTDRQYQRNFFGGDVTTKFFDEKLKLSLGVFQEYDNKNSPIDISLSDEDKTILANAGDNRNKAVRSGVNLAKPDSTGQVKGTYVKSDTLINGNIFEYYIYNPGDSAAIYNVSFSYVGSGNGDYIKESLGNYKFAGKGRGSYLPIIFIPLPSSKQLGNVLLEAKPFENLSLKLEFAGSNWDKNTFSSLDNSDDFGYARNIELNLDPTKISIANINLGKIGISYKDRFIQDNFTSLDRINAVEFDRYYNVSEQTKSNEELREIGLKLIPIDELNIFSKYGHLAKGENFASDRYLTNLTLFKQDEYDVKYNIDYVSSNNGFINTDWLRQNGSANYSFKNFKPGIRFLQEKKEDYNSAADTLLNSSLEYLEVSPYLQLIRWNGFDAVAEYSLREESFPLNGVLTKQSLAKTENFKLSYSGLREFNTSLNFTFRNKEYTDQFKEKGYRNNETILIRSQSRFNFWNRFLNGDLYYEVSTQRSAKLEKVFVRVEKGKGNYIYLGDLNNNGIKDENEFEPAVYDGEYILVTIPTDELYPVIDLKTGTRWKADFSKIFKNNSFISTLLNPVYTETFVRIEENSKEPDTKKIYLLNFNHFLNDSTTIRGSNLLQQDIYLFKNKSDLSFRFRFTQRRNLNQFAGGTEKGFYKERGIRIRFKMVEEISNQTEFTNIIDNNDAQINSNRNRKVTTNDLSTAFSYRPERNLEFGFEIKVGQSRDDYPDIPTIVDQNSQIFRVNINFSGRGRLRLEAERNELNANTTENSIPFEITKGRVIGKNYFLRMNFDYRIAGNLQTTLSYDGRLQGGGKVIHTMRAEARAYF